MCPSDQNQAVLLGDLLLVYPDYTVSNRRTFVVLHRHSSRWFITNRTGVEICRVLAETGSRRTAADLLVRKYGLSTKAAVRDVRPLAEFTQPFLASPGSETERQPCLNSLFLHLTSRCNLSCVHCYAEAGTARPADLSFHLVLDLIGQLKQAGGHSLTLSGGEPLCYPKIEAVVEHACSQIPLVQLLTNATLVTRSTASALAHANLEVQVSIDGDGATSHDRIRGSGSFERAMAGLAVWIETLGPQKVTLCATTMRGNLSSLPGLVELATRLGVARMRLLPLRSAGRASTRDQRPDADEYRSFLDSLLTRQITGDRSLDLSCGVSGLLLDVGPDCSDDTWCPVGRKIVVSAGGDAFPCVLLMHPRFRLGNVSRTSLLELLGTEPMRECCRAVIQRRQRIPECAGCAWQNLCQGGCMGHALEEKGTIWATDQFCAFRAAWYPRMFNLLLDSSTRVNRV
ncbi:MAG: radical SAM protein [Acidobacteriota bacterium]